jgi:phosphopentomutase
MFPRIVWMMLDSVGIGEMPDAADYGDAGSDTLANIARQRPMDHPNMCHLGLGNFNPLAEHLDTLFGADSNTPACPHAGK